MFGWWSAATNDTASLINPNHSFCSKRIWCREIYFSLLQALDFINKFVTLGPGHVGCAINVLGVKRLQNVVEEYFPFNHTVIWR